LADLSGAIAKAQRVVLLLAASDVILLRVNVPPLSSSRMKAALPNLVEEQLIGDPADCVIIAGDRVDGLRTVAVMQRAWLETLYETLSAFGARRITALPAQSCLPFQPAAAGGVLAAANEHGSGVDLTLRLSEHEGTGMTVGAGKNETTAHAVINALCAAVPKAEITLYVPHASVLDYQNEINRTPATSKRIKAVSDNWSHWVAGAEEASLDMLAGLGQANRQNIDLRAWRWPLALAAAVLIVNIAALNFDWWRMHRESVALRASLIQVYKAAYPNESVIIDPVAQIRQKIAAAKHDAGLAAPDDFTALIAAFGEAWASAANTAKMGATDAPPIASFEYRDRTLFVRLSPELNRSGKADSLAQQMKAALADRSLSLESPPSRAADGVWEIRSAR